MKDNAICNIPTTKYSKKWRVIIAVNFQLKQLEGRSLKNIRASTGFEPVTSAIPVRCSTNWAVKPHIGSEVNLLSSCLPVQWNDVKNMKCILNCGGHGSHSRWSPDIFQASSFQLLKLEIYCDDHSSLSSTTRVQYVFHIHFTKYSKS